MILTRRTSGFSLVELMISMLLASLLMLSSLEWFMSMNRFFKVQALYTESSEVGRFSLSYLSKLISRSGQGLPESAAVSVTDGSMNLHYRSDLPYLGLIRNCLGNESKFEITEDRLIIEKYSEGGKELKCVSSGSGDWLAEGVQGVSYQLAVDQGSFEGSEFVLGRFDGVPDAYLPIGSYVSASMKILAIHVSLQTYRSTIFNKSHIDHWQDGNENFEQAFYGLSSL